MQIKDNITNKIEEKKEELRKKVEEMLEEILKEIFGVPPAISDNENKILNPTQPNMDLLEKVFEILRKLQ